MTELKPPTISSFQYEKQLLLSYILEYAILNIPADDSRFIGLQSIATKAAPNFSKEYPNYRLYIEANLTTRELFLHLQQRSSLSYNPNSTVTEEDMWFNVETEILDFEELHNRIKYFYDDGYVIDPQHMAITSWYFVNANTPFNIMPITMHLLFMGLDDQGNYVFESHGENDEIDTVTITPDNIEFVIGIPER